MRLTKEKKFGKKQENFFKNKQPFLLFKSMRDLISQLKIMHKIYLFTISLATQVRINLLLVTEFLSIVRKDKEQWQKSSELIFIYKEETMQNSLFWD